MPYYTVMAVLGLVYLLLTFVICFTAVHVVKLTVIGFLALKRRKSPKSNKRPKVKANPYII